MVEVYGRKGIWMWYGHGGEGVMAHFVSDKFETVARRQAQEGYDRVGFWPMGTTIEEAVLWWEQRDEQPLAMTL